VTRGARFARAKKKAALARLWPKNVGVGVERYVGRLAAECVQRRGCCGPTIHTSGHRVQRFAQSGVVEYCILFLKTEFEYHGPKLSQVANFANALRVFRKFGRKFIELSHLSGARGAIILRRFEVIRVRCASEHPNFAHRAEGCHERQLPKAPRSSWSTYNSV
jgi:hypothetical protein